MKHNKLAKFSNENRMYISCTVARWNF